MIKYNQYIKENKKSLKNKWFDSVISNSLDVVKKLINQGIDINIKDDIQGNTALIFAIMNGSIDMVKFLLEQPEIDINIKNNNGWDALSVAHLYDQTKIEYILFLRSDLNKSDEDFRNLLTFYNIKQLKKLKNYKFQKDLLNNEKDDIILKFNKHDLVHPKIKEEYPELFKAKNWGLIE
jgi:ankyrin repeat protein